MQSQRKQRILVPCTVNIPEAMLGPAAVYSLMLLICMQSPPTAQAALQNESAISQTYESVHLTEAARKAKGDEGNLEDLLHWAIEHSDPEQLKQQAETVGRENLDLTDRQKEVQQVQRLKMHYHNVCLNSVGYHAPATYSHSGLHAGHALQMMRDMQAAPTEIDLMKDTIDVLTNSSAPPE